MLTGLKSLPKRYLNNACREKLACRTPLRVVSSLLFAFEKPVETELETVEQMRRTRQKELSARITPSRRA